MPADLYRGQWPVVNGKLVEPALKGADLRGVLLPLL
jgi:hypothetical protein